MLQVWGIFDLEGELTVTTRLGSCAQVALDLLARLKSVQFVELDLALLLQITTVADLESLLLQGHLQIFQHRGGRDEA